jgi:hypothetical protein
MFGWFELLSLVLGSGAVVFATYRYVRKRSRLRRAIRASEPLARDGWLTGPEEPDYMDIYNEQQREAFSSFGHLLLYGAGLIALGLHILVRHSLAETIGFW